MQKYKLSFEEVKEELSNRGFVYIGGEYCGMNSKLVCKDCDGYYVLCNLQKMFYKNKTPRIIDAKNPNSILNIKRIVSEHTNGEFDCLSDTYSGNRCNLVFRHNKCGRTFENKWINIWRERYKDSPTSNKTGLFCPHCNTKQIESTHALVLKQVWLNEEPDTIVEDKTCINPNTNCCLPTDIVNHRLKIAIEVQSWFHDFDRQQTKDKIKKEFWINKGYTFYAVDQRDYTVLEMIQLFFPNILEIPDYIDFEYSNKIDDVLAQRLLNEYMSVPKVAAAMSCDPHIIYNAIYDNRISYPDNYTNSCYIPVVQLDLNERFLSSYNTIQEAADSIGASPGAIAKCLRENKNYSSGYYWVYKNEYESGNYSISKCRFKNSA